MLIARSACIILAISLSHAAQADTLHGRVIGIADGDTLTILDANRDQHRIRLAGIDAPERKQPFGQASKQSLSDLAYDRDVDVEWHKSDRYGRIIGKVLVSGVDANLIQIKKGMAWHYKKYESEQSVADRRAYAAAEDRARQQRQGLWREQHPIAPWDWRKGTR